ncbi:MAG: hypothetical protein HYU67_04665 [Flavobacteriia bacterium]|nr:hypothetical protein [Flavobacteriia bacterium]
MKKKPCKTKVGARVTSSSIKKDLNSLGYRLPHGYDVVKKTCKKPKTKKK